MRHLLDLIALLDLTAAREPGTPALMRNPTARPSLVKHEEVEDHRSLSCSQYDACLDVVLRRRWLSWTCSRCALFPLRKDVRAAEFTHDASLRPLA